MLVRRLSDSELYHHGVKGQRWGIRRFQNKDGTLTSAGRKRRGLVEQIKINRRMKKLRKAKIKKQNEKAKREEIINSGNRKAIKKIQKQLTNEELDRAIKRIEFNQKLNTIDPSKKAQVAIFVDKYANTAKNLGDYADTASKVMKAISNAKKLANGIYLSDEKKK